MFSLFVSEPGEAVVTAFWLPLTVQVVETIEGLDHFGGAHRDPSRPGVKATIQVGEYTLQAISMRSPDRANTY